MAVKGRTTVYHAGLVTDAKWEKVNPANKELLDEFIEYLQGAGKSPQTIKQYTAQLKIIFVYLLEHAENKCFVDIKKREMVKFATWLSTDLKVSGKRISSMKSVVSSLSNFIELVLDDEYPDFRNISKVISVTSNEAVREKTVLSEEQINECLQKLVADKKYQVACFMALLYASGMRKAEALQMRVDDFTEERKVFSDVFYGTHKIRTKGHGVDGKQLVKYVFCDIFDPYLKLWLEERTKQGIVSPWLFVVYKDGEYHQAIISTANSFAETISKYLGMPGYCHNFRHAWCTRLSKMGYPETLIQNLQGWANLDMVTLYNDQGKEEAIDDFFKKQKNEEEAK